MRVLCTGSSGFIGSHLVKELKKRGHEVYRCDIVAPSDTELHFKDIRNITAEELEGFKIDWIFHLGAASGSLYFDPPAEGCDINCIGTLKLLEAARKAKVKKVIFASTGSTYADTPLPHTEATPLNCPNFYSASKIFGEHCMKLYHDLYGLETVILRFASVYGDNEDPKKGLANPVSQFIWKIMLGEQPIVWHNGHQTRDFIFVDDIVYANVFAAETLKHGIYNAGTGVETTFRKLIDLINKELNTNIEPIYQDFDRFQFQKKYVSKQLFDTNKLASRGWHFTVTIDEGIHRIVENIRSRPNYLETIPRDTLGIR